jgi:hypothetical protein
MIRILLFALYARWAAATLHHLFVGTVDGGSLYVLELDDISRSLTVLRNESAAGASPSIAFDVSIDTLIQLRGRRLLRASAPSSFFLVVAQVTAPYPDTASHQHQTSP